MNTYVRRIFAGALVAIAAVCLSCRMTMTSPLATDLDTKSGGLNQYGDEICESKLDSLKLEDELVSDGYILVSGNGRTISDDAHDEFFSTVGPFQQYADESEYSGDRECKIYVYGPYYTEAMSQLENYGQVSASLRASLSYSSVMVDYGVWYSKDRVGSVVNEYNDNIPEWVEQTGYLKVISPFSIELTLKATMPNTYNIIHINGGEPTLIKLPCSEFVVTEINGVEISESDVTLPYGNNIKITKEHTEDNPYLIDLEETLDANGIVQAGDGITDTETHTPETQDPNSPETENTESVTVETVTVDETVVDEPAVPQASSIVMWVIIIIVGAAIIATVVVVVIKKKHDKIG